MRSITITLHCLSEGGLNNCPGAVFFPKSCNRGVPNYGGGGGRSRWEEIELF